MFGVVYKITDHTNGKLYVGKTTQTIEERFKGHKYAPSLIGDAIRDHKPENFTIEVIKECQNAAELKEQELFFINSLNTWEPNGYNCKNRTNTVIQHEPTRRLTDIFDRPDLKSTKTFSLAQLRYFVVVAELEKFNVVATYNLLFNAAILAREGIGYPISLDKLTNDAELCFRPIEPEFSSPLKFIWRKNFLLTPQAQVLLDEMRRLYK